MISWILSKSNVWEGLVALYEFIEKEILKVEKMFEFSQCNSWRCVNNNLGEMHNYRIIHNIGSGTFGDVYLAEDRHTEELVAIKVLKQSMPTLEDCLKLREVRALRKFKHPNLMSMKNMHFQNGQLFIICEYVSGNLYDEFIAIPEKRPSIETVK